MERPGHAAAAKGTRSSRARGAAKPRAHLPTRGRGGRIAKHTPRSQHRKRVSTVKGELNHDARESETPPTFSKSNTMPSEVQREQSIHACSEASLEFVKFAGLRTTEDTNILTLNLMDYFLFSPANWLPELSYCRLHATCFLFACHLTGQDNTVEQVANSLGPKSDFVQLVGDPLAGDEESAAAIHAVISVTVTDVEDGYRLLYERKEMFGLLLGQYAAKLDDLPAPLCVDSGRDCEIAKDEDQNFDLFEAE